MKKAKHLEYNRTSPKVKEYRARYQADGKSAACQRRSKRKQNATKAIAELARIAVELEARL